MASVRSADLAGSKVNFGSDPELGIKGAIGTLANGRAASDPISVNKKDELSDLGVAVEGLRANLMTSGTVRIGIGGQQFRFHRDSTYEPQAYLRAREIENGAGSRQGESSFVPGR